MKECYQELSIMDRSGGVNIFLLDIEYGNVQVLLKRCIE